MSWTRTHRRAKARLHTKATADAPYGPMAAVAYDAARGFRRTVWLDPELPGPMFGLEGALVGHEMFHRSGVTLSMGFELAGLNGLVGFDLTGLTSIDDMNSAQFALTARQRVLKGGRMRLVLPGAAWGAKLLDWVRGCTRQIVLRPDSSTVIDL